MGGDVLMTLLEPLVLPKWVVYEVRGEGDQGEQEGKEGAMGKEG